VIAEPSSASYEHLDHIFADADLIWYSAENHAGWQQISTHGDELIDLAPRH
jgi:hypothetical protein